MQLVRTMEMSFEIAKNHRINRGVDTKLGHDNITLST